MKNELQKVNPVDYELTQDKAKEIESAFAPKIAERESFVEEYELIISGVIDADLCTKAGTLRKKLVKVRTGIDKIHKSQKSLFLQAGRFVDAWKNAETLPVSQMEEKLSSIEKHFENIEKDRIQKLNEERSSALTALGVEWIPGGLAQMCDEEWKQYLHGCEVAKKEREEAELKAKEEKAAKEKAEAEEKERIKSENEKLKQEAEQRERIEAERREKEAKALREVEEKARKEREESEAKLKEEREQRERIEAEQKAAIAKEKAESATIAALEKDKENRKRVNNLVMKSLIDLGVDPSVSKAFVKSVALGNVVNLKIDYSV